MSGFGKKVGSRLLAVAAVVAIVGSLFAVFAASPASAIDCNAIQGPSCSLTAFDDSYVIGFGQTLRVAAPGVLLNDTTATDISVDTVSSDTMSFGGATVDINSDGSFTYTPDTNNPFSGLDSFTYYIQDTGGDSDFATVNIRVDAKAVDDTYYTHVNTPLHEDAPGVFANDLGVGPGVLSYDGTTAHGGTTILNDDGSFDYTPPNATYQGEDSFKYTAWNINDDNFFTATTHIFVDSTAPAPAMGSPTAVVTLATSFPVSWSATDLSGIAHYDVQVETAGWNGGFGAFSGFKNATTATSANFTGSPGHTYCFRVRATDNAGNTSGYTAVKCTAVGLKASSLSYSAGWKSQNSSAYYGGAATYTTTSHATSTRTGVWAKRVFLIATKCSTCGTVQIKWNSTVTANISLVASGTAHKQVIIAVSLGAVAAGTVTITVTSATGKSVIIEGLAVSRV
jgi:hypothetical protein